MRFSLLAIHLFLTHLTYAQPTTTSPSLTISGDSTGVRTDHTLEESLQVDSPFQDPKLDSLSTEDVEVLLKEAESRTDLPPDYRSWLDSLKQVHGIKLDSTTADKAIEVGTDIGLQRAGQVAELKQGAEIIEQVQTEIGSIHQVPGKFGSLKDSLAKPEGIENMLTEHAQSMAEFTELSTQQAAFDQLQSQFDPERMAKEQEKFLKQREKYAEQFEQYQDGDFQKAQLEEQALMRVKTTTDKLARHSKEVDAAQTKLAKLKKKYSYVPNSNDLSTAVKRNSLQGKPIKDRLVLGGTFQVQIAENSNVDLSPLIGYKMNKKWWVGSGFTYRASFGSDVKLSDAFDDQVYGWRMFSEYTAWKDFFAHGEWERMSGILTDQVTGEAMGRRWCDGLLLGVGKNYNFIKKVKGNVMVLYDFLHGEDSVYPKAWVVRFGFFVDGLSSFKK